MKIHFTRIESHIFFWIGLISIFSIIYGFENESNTILVLAADHLMSLPLYLLVSYGLAYFLFPKLLSDKTKWYLVPLFFLYVMLLALVEIFKTNYISMPLLFPEKEQMFGLNIYDLSRSLFYLLLPSVFFVSIKYLKGWYVLNVQKKELESENLRNELQILKSQIQPEFIIDLLEILKCKADKDPNDAAKGIEQVSELLSFVLYESNQSEIDLEKEIQLIAIFISLMEIKSNHEFEYRFSKIGNVAGLKIVPLTLYTLVEYIFKYLNGNDNENEKLQLTLYLEMQAKNIDFWIESPNCQALLKGLEEDQAISNLKKRLTLTYNNSYYFECKQVNGVQKLHLNINVT